MIRCGKKSKILAAVLAAGIILSMQGMTAFAGRTGVGAAKPAQTGPGVAAQNDSQPGQAGGQTVQPEGQNGQTEGQAAQAEGQTGQAEGQTAQPVGQEQSTQPVTGQEPLQVNYSAFILQQGWSAVTADNNLCSAPVNSWVTAVKANLIHIPDGTQVGIRYQVNLSGTGWLSWAEDGAETGGAEGVMPLESIRMELTGSGAAAYDLYYKVLQNGAWTDWAANGASAGQEGAGLRVDGIRASITAKGAGIPAEPVVPHGIDPSRPMIALTFDDGPHEECTAQLLDGLKERGVRVTFFLMGQNIEGNEELVKRMHDEGHLIGNHSFSHVQLTKAGAKTVCQAVDRTSRMIEDITGERPQYMRPPFGDWNEELECDVGMTTVLWSVDSLDWKLKNKNKIVKRVLKDVEDGDIILMHDIFPTSVQAALELIDTLTRQGYTFVTVDELLID